MRQQLERIESKRTESKRTETKPSVYEPWLNQPVVLQVMAGDLRVPLHGTILSENEQAVRFRVGEGWEMDVFKSMILAVEQDQFEDSIT